MKDVWSKSRHEGKVKTFLYREGKSRLMAELKSSNTKHLVKIKNERLYIWSKSKTRKAYGQSKGMKDVRSKPRHEGKVKASLYREEKSRLMAELKSSNTSFWSKSRHERLDIRSKPKAQKASGQSQGTKDVREK
jgi:ribosomal protein L25 (general stress protein Ctc)